MKLAGWLLLAAGTGWAGAQGVPPAAAGEAPKLVSWLLVPDKPYAATRDYDRDQKRGGKTLTLHESTKIWRDSAGRIRSEVTREKAKVVRNTLIDPAAMVQYRWNSEEKVVYMTKLGEPNHVKTDKHPLTEGEVRDVTTKVDGVRFKARVSLLPPKTFFGYSTIGTHQIGYSDPDRKVVFSTIDSWYETEYCVTFEETITDEQYGHRVFRFRSFKAGEPKADLFEVPKGYTVKQAAAKPESEEFE